MFSIQKICAFENTRCFHSNKNERKVATNEGSDIMRTILAELEQLKSSNELRDRKIENLERQITENKHTYEEQLAIIQMKTITELELQLSEKVGFIEKYTAQTGSTVESKRRIRQLGSSSGVAFTAYLSQNVGNLGHEHTIPFDSVILNEGQGFNANTHEFTCPVTGVYTFQTALLSTSHSLSITEIVKENVQLVQAHAEGASFDQGFNSVVTKCMKGESVWVRNYQHFGSTAYSERYTTFTGYLLWETE